nr:hypothetical protein CFP56_46618 [Quercus suber]
MFSRRHVDPHTRRYERLNTTEPRGQEGRAGQSTGPIPPFPPSTFLLAGSCQTYRKPQDRADTSRKVSTSGSDKRASFWRSQYEARQSTIYCRAVPRLIDKH